MVNAEATKPRMNRCALCGREYPPLSPEEMRRRMIENPDLNIVSIFCDECLKQRAAAMDQTRGTKGHLPIKILFGSGEE